MVNKYYQKNKEKLQKKDVKGIKIFLTKKKKKGEKRPKTDIKVFLKKIREKKREYHRDRHKNLSEEENQMK